MENELENIIAKAAELSSLIRSSGAAMEYESRLAEISRDRGSLELLDRLTAAGREIHEKTELGETIVPGHSAEYQLIEEELKDNQLVKDFLLAQKSYLQLMQDVINLIKDPEGGNH